LEEDLHAAVAGRVLFEPLAHSLERERGGGEGRSEGHRGREGGRRGGERKRVRENK
jgi:hypothetical protein